MVDGPLFGPRPDPSPQQIVRRAIQDHYTRIAKGEGPAAGDLHLPRREDGTVHRFYAEATLARAPECAVSAFTGCGNPTALAGLQPGERVIDLGCGAGLDCFLAAQAVGEEGEVLGIDVTAAMIDLARSGVEPSGSGSLLFSLRTMEAIPMADESLDVVISNGALNLSLDKDQTLSEANRVLVPGGRVVISTYAVLKTLPEDVRFDQGLWVAGVGGADGRDELLERIAAAGLSRVEIAREGPAARYENEPWAESLVSVTVCAAKPVT